MIRTLALCGILLMAASLLAAQDTPSGFMEFQLQGELVAEPRYFKGRGIAVLTDDRKITMVDPDTGSRVSWTLPRRAVSMTCTASGLLGAQLQDGRLALINVDGRLIRIQPRASTEGWWLVADNGRLWHLGPNRIQAFGPRGDRIGERALKDAVASVEAVETWGWRLTLSDGRKGHMGTDGVFIEGQAQGEARPFELEVRPGSYEVESVSAGEHFQYEAKADLNRSAWDPEHGLLMWGDSRWKLFVKRLPPQKPSPVIQAPALQRSGSDLRELGYLFSSGRTGGSDITAFFAIRMKNLENLDWLSLLLRDLLADHEMIPESAVQGPEIRRALLALVPVLFGIHDASWCAQRSMSRPHEVWDFLEIMDRIGLDTRGQYTESLRALLQRSSTRDVPRAQVVSVLRRLGPSLPDLAIPDWRQLLYRLGETSSQ